MTFTYKSSPVVQSLAKLACDIQDAPNGVAVANELLNAMIAIRKDQKLGSDDLHKHPVVRLLLHKLNTLCNIDDRGGMDSYHQSALLREGEEVEQQ